MLEAVTANWMDQGLLSRAGEGDQAAFAGLVREHQSMVYGIALHSLGDTALAEEIAQDVFLQLFRNLGRIESPAHLVHWLRRVSVNRCIDEARRRRLRPVALDEAEHLGSDDQDRDPFAQRLLRRFLGELPPKQRAVITLRYQEELELGEIAATLSLPVNTVKSHLRRGLAALRKRIERAEKGGSDGHRA
ncbi:MAG: RNA polymerase sigma factor [Thermoanaerobaculia bacterium]